MNSDVSLRGTKAAIREIHGTPLSTIVLNEMREAIVQGELAPGETINQVELSREFGVSRAPLREALRQLEKEGLVTNVPYRGTIVTPLTARSIRELIVVRQLFETYAAQQIIASMDDSVFPALKVSLVEMKESAERRDLDALNAADIAFHTQVVHASGNRLMTEIWDRYIPAIRRTLTLRNRVNQDLNALVDLHQDLLDALESRDMDRLARGYAVHGTDITSVLEPLFDHEDDEPS